MIGTQQRHAGQMPAFEEYLTGLFTQGDGFSAEVSQAVLQAGGKRLRPMLTIAFAMAGDQYDRDKTFATAAAVELLHTATLVHDDIVDESQSRRGQPSVNARYGTQMAVYVGDYLLVKALQQIAKRDEYNTKQIHGIIRTLTRICTGEINQFYAKHTVGSTLAYFRRIRHKTALLFATASLLGAYDAQFDDRALNQAFRFGLYYGMAFQIRDDVQNYTSTAQAAGKPVANDLAEGIVTLPALMTCAKLPGFDKRIRDSFGNPAAQAELIGDIIRLGVPESQAVIGRYAALAQKALDTFTDTTLKRDMQRLLVASYA